MKYNENGKPEILRDLSEYAGRPIANDIMKSQMEDRIHAVNLARDPASGDFDDSCVRMSLSAFYASEDFKDDVGAVLRFYLTHSDKNPLLKDPLFLKMKWNDCELYGGAIMIGMLYDCMTVEAIAEARAGESGWARYTWLYCLKTYRSDAYKQLKKLRSLSLDSISSITGVDLNQEVSDVPIPQRYEVALVLVAAELLGIPEEGECVVARVFASEHADGFEEDMDDYYGDAADLAWSVDAMRNGIEWDDEKENEERARLYGIFPLVGEFLEISQRYHGLPCASLRRCLFPDYGVTRQLLRVRDEEDFIAESGESMCLYAVIDALVGLIARMRENTEMIGTTLLFGSDYADPPVLFDPSKVFGCAPVPGKPMVSPSAKGQERAEKRAPDASPIFSDAPQLSPSEEELTARVKYLTKEVVALRERAAGKQRVERECERLSQTAEEQRTELAALRSFVHSLTREDEKAPADDLPKMREFLRNKRISVIGGHQNWVAKMKREFPEWNFIPTGKYGLDAQSVKNNDFVFFFTDVLSHVTYARYMTELREGGIPFGYLHGVNVAGTISQAYAAMNSAK